MRFTLCKTGAEPDEYLSLAAEAEATGWSSMCLDESMFQSVTVDSSYPYT